MKPGFVLSISLSVLLTVAAQAQEHPADSARIVEGYGKLPLAFEANQGQSDPQVKFLSRGAGYSLFLTADAAVLSLAPSVASAMGAGRGSHSQSARAVLQMKLVNTNPKTQLIGLNELPGRSNYFIGNDPTKWHTNVRQFSKVRYENVYPGVDLVYYGHQRELEYNFVLQPGASPEAIRLGIAGARRLRLEHGDLVLASAAGNVHLRSPHIYQETDGVRHEVRGRYLIKSSQEVGFEVAGYDRRRELVIDPVLAYATFLGGSSDDDGSAIAVDSAGHAYVTGTTFSTDFPTVNAIQPTFHGGRDVFVTKINADGTALGYSTYLGGSGSDFGTGIALDSAGNAYVAGTTDSTDFPTVNAIQSTSHGNLDVFVTKISADGTALIYSTYLGGSGNDRGGCCNGFGPEIALDSTGNAYLTGSTDSTDFPTKNAIQPAYGGGDSEVFVTKINSNGSALVYSTYLGGSLRDESDAIAVDSTGNAYATGWTESTDFPTKNAFQPTNHGGTDHGAADAFVTKINAGGSALVYSTYLGGNDFEQCFGIAVDSTGNAYVTGVTWSTDFPTVNAIQPTLPVGSHAFVTKFSANGSAPVYSTYLGGSGSDHGYGIKADASGNAYVTGFTSSTNFPTVNAIQSSPTGGFLSKINAGGSAFIYSTYLSSSFRRIVLDSANSAYLVGSAGLGYPTTPVAFQLSPRGSDDAVIAKVASETFVHLSTQKLTFPTQVIGTTSTPKKVNFTNRGSGTLTIHKIYIGGLNPRNFAQTNNCGTTLAPSTSCVAFVTFTPSAKDKRQAGLGFSTPDPASPDAVALSGTGTVVSLSASKLTFGDQALGTTSPPQNLMLTNTGSTQLNFGGIYILGMNAGNFSQINNCGTSIAAKASCTIAVTFTPTATGIRTAALYIRDDGGGSPQKVNLTGTGT